MAGETELRVTRFDPSTVRGKNLATRWVTASVWHDY
jgi:hypothetical protein